MTGGKLDKAKLLVWLAKMRDKRRRRLNLEENVWNEAIDQIMTGRFDAPEEWPSNRQHDAMMARFVDDFDREIGFEPRQPVGD